MKIIKISASLVILTLCVGCAPKKQVSMNSQVPGSFTGKTLATGQMRANIYEMAMQLAKRKINCDSTTPAVRSQFFQVLEMPKFNNGVAVSGQVVEKWQLMMCRRSADVFVNYMFTPEGRTNYGVSLTPIRKGLLESMPVPKS